MNDREEVMKTGGVREGRKWVMESMEEVMKDKEG